MHSVRISKWAVCLVPIAIVSIIGSSMIRLKAENLEEAVKLHDLAWDGDATKLTPSIELLQTLNEEQPDNPIIVAYLGSAFAISARESWSIITKARLGNKGLEYLDQALQMSPNHIVVRKVRADVQIAMPKMLGRWDDAIEDLIALDELFRQNPSPKLAEDMLKFYDILMAEVPYRGDWAEGKSTAEYLSILGIE